MTSFSACGHHSERAVAQSSPLVVPSPTSSSSSSRSSSRLQRMFHWHEYPSPSSLEPLYRLYTYPAEYSSLRSLIVLFIAWTVSAAAVSFIHLWHLTLESISCVALCVAALTVLVFIHTRFMSPRHLTTVCWIEQMNLLNILLQFKK